MRIILYCCVCLFSGNGIFAQSAERPNIIVIISDDLNDYISPLGGHPQVNTPAISSLAERGVTFFNAYCNAPVCGPSRTSFLSGKDMLYTQVYDNNNYQDYFRDNFTEAKGNAEVFTIPEYLKNAGGYYTYGINKVFHNPFAKDYDVATADPCEKLLSWSDVDNVVDDPSIASMEDEVDLGLNGYRFGSFENSAEQLLKDAKAADSAVSFIQKWVNNELPACGGNFFMAVGLAKPHLDLFVPEKYFPEYYLENIAATPFIYPYNNPAQHFPPNGIIMPPQPETRWEDYYNLGPIAQAMSTGQKAIEESVMDYAESVSPLPEIDPSLSDTERKQIIAEAWRANAMIAYIAAVQFMDAQVQKILNALNANPELKNNTVIIFIGDNGFSFGEKHHWLKRSLWEMDTRVPMIIVDPAHAGNKMSYRTVSLLDIFPTVCDMAGMAYPQFSDGSNYLDGHSLMPLIINPDTCWEKPALITFEAEDNKESSCFPQHNVRSDKFSYIRYQSDNGNLSPNGPCDWSNSIREEELYEVGIHRETDPQEWNNLIDNPDYAPVADYLSQFLPGESLYLQKTFKAIIEQQEPECIYTKTDTIFCMLHLFDTEGNAVEIPDGFTAHWKTNADTTSYFGNAIAIPISSIPPVFYETQKRIIIYFTLTENTTQTDYAFDMQYAYINPVQKPEVSFNIITSDISTITITDLQITGTYTALWWDFGDGTILQAEQDISYTYAAPGNYAVTCFVEYGNAACLETFVATAIIDDNAAQFSEQLLIYPNPADSRVNISSGKYFDNADLQVWSVSGALVSEIHHINGFYVQLNTAALHPGVYFLIAESAYGNSYGRLVVLH